MPQLLALGAFGLLCLLILLVILVKESRLCRCGESDLLAVCGDCGDVVCQRCMARPGVCAFCWEVER